MTPQNAIALLRQVESNWVANGTDHQNFNLAIRTLEAVVATAETQGKVATPNAPAAGESESGSEPTGEQADSTDANS